MRRVGGARGVDSVALLRATAALAPVSVFAHRDPVRIEVVVPTKLRDQPIEAREAFRKAKSIYDHVNLIELGEPAWNHQRYQRRNVAMLLGGTGYASDPHTHWGPRSDLLLTFWNGVLGGTKNAVEAAMGFGIMTCVVPISGTGDD